MIVTKGMLPRAKYHFSKVSWLRPLFDCAASGDNGRLGIYYAYSDQKLSIIVDGEL